MAGKRRAYEPTLRDVLEMKQSPRADIEFLAMIISAILTVVLVRYLLEMPWTLDWLA